MGVELYNRKVDLTVAQINGSPGLRVKDLRVAFDISKSSTSEPNAATVDVYNLNDQSRAFVETKNQVLILKAGYEDLLSTILIGNVRRVEHEFVPPDIITHMEVRDGGKSLYESEFRRYYPAGSSKLSVVRDILGSMEGIETGVILTTALNGTTKKLSLSGLSRVVLDRRAKAWGFEWSVQDGTAMVLDRGSTTVPQASAIILNRTSGLLDSPVKTQRGAKFKSLLRPDMPVGGFVIVQSRFLTARLKVESLRHVGDTKGNTWNTEAEGRKI